MILSVYDAWIAPFVLSSRLVPDKETELPKALAGSYKGPQGNPRHYKETIGVPVKDSVGLF